MAAFFMIAGLIGMLFTWLTGFMMPWSFVTFLVVFAVALIWALRNTNGQYGSDGGGVYYSDSDSGSSGDSFGGGDFGGGGGD